MKIVDNRRFEKVFHFGEIDPGDVFSVTGEDPDNAYIKLVSNSNVYNAFNLRTNERAQFSNTAVVAIINAEVVLQ